MEDFPRDLRIDGFTSTHQHKEDCVRVYAIGDKALKIVEKNRDPEGIHFNDLKREYEVLSKLNHPNIVKVLKKIETDTQFGFFTPCYSKELPKSKLPFIKEQITEAVQYLYQIGLIHRDIHEGNILMDGNTPVLIDFQAAEYRKQTVSFNKSIDIVGNEIVQSCCGPFTQKTLRDLWPSIQPKF